VAAVVGVPESTPVELFSVSHAGNDDPEAIEYVYGPFPPVTVMVAVYFVPTVPLPAEQGPQLRFIGGPVTWMVQVAISVLPLASVTCVLNVYVPAVVGLPESTPVLLSVSPGGSVPEANAYLYGPVPPLADIIAEYDAPTVVLLLPQLPQITVRAGAATTMVQACVSELPFESTTFDVKV